MAPRCESIGARYEEGYYAHDFDPAVLAVQEDLPTEARRARELEAKGYSERPLSFKWREKACYVAATVREVDPDAVRTLRPHIEKEEPGWVEQVKDEWPGRRGDVESVAYFAEVPLQATMAILQNLYERGELKTDDD